MLMYYDELDTLDSDDPQCFVAYDQCWDDETLSELREKHNIFFMTSGDAVIPIMVVGHLVVVGVEDDGTLYFKRQHGQYVCKFSAYWIDSVVADLLSAKEFYKKQIEQGHNALRSV